MHRAGAAAYAASNNVDGVYQVLAIVGEHLKLTFPNITGKDRLQIKETKKINALPRKTGQRMTFGLSGI